MRGSDTEGTMGSSEVQAPNDANRAHMIVAAQMQDFLYHFRWCMVRHLMRDGLLLNQARSALRLIASSPQVECRSRHAEIPTGLDNVSRGSRVLQYPLPSSSLPFSLIHRYSLLRVL